jgi:acetyltransferase-like isoleucine patch superfamily enzyme
MIKYIRGCFYIIYSLVRFSSIKLFHMNGFEFSLLKLISPFTEIDIGKNSKLSLGEKVNFKSGSKIRVRKGAKLKIGRNTFLNHGCLLVAHEKIIVGNNVQLGPNVLIYDHDHDFKKKNGLKNLQYKTSPVEIGDNVWIGANTVILRGTKIGDNCVIGAGSVIKGEFPNSTIILQKRENKVLPYQFE